MTEKVKDGGAYGKWKSALDIAFEGKSKKERLMYPALAAVFTAVAFLLCSKALPYTELSLGIPLSDALLCAAGTYTPFVFVGNILGTAYFGKGSVPRFLAVTLAFVLRTVSSGRSVSDGRAEHAFSETPVTKTAVSAVTCFAECAMYLASNGINGESARVTLATLVTLPALTLIFSVYFAKPAKGRTLRYLYELSMLFLFASAVYCGTGITFAFCSIGTLLAVFLTLCVAKYGGFARGAIFGFVLGYIASPSYFLPFILLGASASLVFAFGVFSACGISAAIASVCAVIVNGTSALVSFIPQTVIATALTTPILRYSFLPTGFPCPFIAPENAESFSEASKSLLAHLSSWHALRDVSDGLKNLSESVNTLTEPSLGADGTAEEILQKVCTGFCDSCTLSPICLDTEADRTRMALRDLIKLYSENRNEMTENVPPYLSSHCIRLRELTEYVKKEVDSLPPSRISTTEPLLLSYSSVSDMLSLIAENAEKELVFDRKTESALAKALYSSGVPFTGISVVGKTRKKLFIYGVHREKLKNALPEIDKSLKKLLGSEYLPPVFGDTPDSPAVFSPAEKLSAEVAFSGSCKQGEAVNGDTALSFNDGDGNFYALIADGMGSGALAGKSSTLTAELIKKLMLCKIDEKVAMRLTNEALGSLCDECFSTVDLLKLDLVSGAATVTKNHAAASYILRSGSVYCCDAQSMPLGINGDAAPKEMSFSLADGDVVIMVSDGIAEGPQDSVKIADILGLSGDLDAKALSERILSKAIELKGQSDDMSAMVIKVKKAA